MRHTVGFVLHHVIACDSQRRAPYRLVRARITSVLERRRLVLENHEYQTRLEQKLQAQVRRIAQQFLGGVQALAEALEAKDPYRHGHSVRVSQYAIATRLQLPQPVIRAITLGGRLLDLGKIGVREEILTNPARLTPEEYAHVITHPIVGWRILSAMVIDQPELLNIVRSHHKRMDGAGLPEGLLGADIPLEARIVSVADSFHAMTSGRRYRDDGGKQLPDALKELPRCAGTQFDADCVGAFLEAIECGDVNLLPRTDTAF